MSNGFGSVDDTVSVRFVADTSGYVTDLGAAAQATVAETATIKRSVAEIVAAQNAQMISFKDFTKTGAEYAAAQAAIAAATDRTTQSVVRNTEAQVANTAAVISSRTAYESGVLISEALTGNYTRMERSLAALGNSTGVLRSLAEGFAAVPAPVYAVVAAVAAVVVAYAEHQKYIGELQQSLITTGGAAGYTAEGLDAVAVSIGESIGLYGKGRDAVLALAESGKIFGDNFALIATGVAAWSQLTGQSIDQVVKEFDKIADNPTKAIAALNEQYHFLTVSQYQQIDAEQKAGDIAKAATDAENLFAQAAVDRLSKVEAALPPVVKYWHDVEAGAGAAWNAMLHLGDNSVDSQMDGLLKSIMNVKDQLAGMAAQGLQETDVYKSQAALVAGWEQQYLALLNTRGKTEQDLAAKKAADDAAAAAAAIKAQQNIDDVTKRYEKQETAMDKIAKVQKEITDSFLAGGNLPKGMSIDFSNPDGAKLAGPAWDEIVHNIEKAAGLLKDSEAAQKKYNEALQKTDELAGNVNKDYEDILGKTDPLNTFIQQQTDSYYKLGDAQAAQLDNDQKMIDNAQTLAQKTAAQIQYAQDLETANEQLARADETLTADIQKHVAALGDWDTWNQKILKDYADEEEKAGMTTAQKRAYEEATKAQEQALKDLQAAKGKDAQLSADEIAQLKSEAEAHVATEMAIEAHKKAMDELQGIMTNGLDSLDKSIADFATHSIKTWKDFGTSLVTDAQQFIAAIIAEFLKLEVFNGIINNLFGSNLPTMGSLGGAGGGLGAVVSFGSSLFGGAGGAGGSGGWLSNAGSLYSGNNGLFNQAGTWASNTLGLGEAGGVYTASGFGAVGSSDALGLVPDYAGIGGAGDLGGTAGTYGGELSGGAGAGGSIGGAFGGAMTGWEIGSRLGGTAGGIVGAGALGYLGYMVPVLGWIMLAASVINGLTGGGLFGTDATKAVGGNLSESIGANGARIWGEETYKGKKPLFGGSYYEEHNIPIDDKTQSAVDQFYQALLNGRDAFAGQFNVQMGDLVGGVFHETLDATGKVTATDDTVLGVKRTETEQQFEERLQADNYLAVLDKLGLGASDFVKQFQDDADKLSAAVQDFATTTQQANNDLGAGFHFMALSSDATLVDVMKWVEGMQRTGETLQQTYQRLQQAQLQYEQFVQQFKPAVQYTDDFEASLANVYAQEQANEAQANALAQAAGAQGASYEDLLNIQKQAVSQTQQLVLALQNSAQQLAFSLGLTEQGSLDQVTAQINALESQANQTVTSVHNFGNAIAQVSQQATAAMNLMLGNLSPYDDQMKLQIALQGLRAGTVSADTVLGIGRNLYASSEAYNQLFDEVLPYAGAGTGGGGGGGGSATTTTKQGLSAADQKKLDELLKEQADMQKAATLEQYQTLAQQIAEIAMAKNEDWHQVVDDMGINLKDFEAALGLKDDDAFNTYIKNIESQTDSQKNNTQSIVDAIMKLPIMIAQAISGQPITGSNNLPGGAAGRPTAPGAGGSSTGGVTTITPATVIGGGAQPGSRGGSNNTPPPGRQLSDGDAQAVGGAVAKALTPILNQITTSPSRSNRPIVNSNR